MAMDTADELSAVIDEIRSAKPVPFSASAMVNKKSLVDRLEEVRENLPREIQQAHDVVADREEALSQARAEVEAMIREAEAERDRLLTRTEIVGAASREADRIIEDAKIRAREIRMEAEDYVDAKLASFEIVLQKTLAAVARGRESLRGRLESGHLEPGVIEDLTRTNPGAPQIRARRR
jgi:cell division septum initiation protein DivIVA